MTSDLTSALEVLHMRYTNRRIVYFTLIEIGVTPAGPPC